MMSAQRFFISIGALIALSAGLYVAVPRVTHAALEHFREQGRAQIRTADADSLARAERIHSRDQYALNSGADRIAALAEANKVLISERHADAKARMHQAIVEGRDPALEWAAYVDRMCQSQEGRACGPADGRTRSAGAAGAAGSDADAGPAGIEHAGPVRTACGDDVTCYIRLTEALTQDRDALLDYSAALVAAKAQDRVTHRSVVSIVDALNAANAKPGAGPET